ncbi:hypothetical protein SDC9_202818 [bioreactor metagenome]|uniref:Uncharacterized protein n=1 Tax=bioreactor metagenome TaxID=1076179 RepID=A0A645IXH2_9ZZZZ
MAVYFQKHVASFNTGFGGGSIFHHTINDDAAFHTLDVEILDHILGHRLHRNTDPGPYPVHTRFQILQHIQYRAAGNSKTDALGSGVYRRIDADNFAVEVQHRTAGVAGVDGGVGLQQVLIHGALNI